MAYKVIKQVLLDGEYAMPGAIVNLDDASAERLLSKGTVEKTDEGATASPSPLEPTPQVSDSPQQGAIEGQSSPSESTTQPSVETPPAPLQPTTLPETPVAPAGSSEESQPSEEEITQTLESVEGGSNDSGVHLS